MTTTATGAPERVPGTEVRESGQRWSAIVLVVALVAAAGAVGWWLGARSDQVQASDTIEQWAEAWSARDVDAFAELYEPDGVFDGVLGVRFEGREAIREGIAGYWSDTDVQLELEYVFENDTQGVAVWNILEDGRDEGNRNFTVFEWAWDDPALLRSTTMNW